MISAHVHVALFSFGVSSKNRVECIGLNFLFLESELQMRVPSISPLVDKANVDSFDHAG